MMSSFAFIILHYQTLDDTVRCVESIFSHAGTDDADVVIVDNGSPNGTGRLLADKYAGQSRVKVLLNPVNLGFARGNNVGFRWAKDQLGAEFIALLNNDIVLATPDFIKRVRECHRQTSFHVMGPDIVSLATGRHQNPRRVAFDTPFKVRKNLLYLGILLAATQLHAERLFNAAYEGLRTLVKGRRPSAPPGAGGVAREFPGGELDRGWQLFGACLIFSPEYVKSHDGLYDGTFLYLEEEILSYQCRQQGLKMVYAPELVVQHGEQSSARSEFPDNRKRELFQMRHLVRSNVELLKIMRASKAGSADSPGNVKNAV